jgi:type III secretion protein R
MNGQMNNLAVIVSFFLLGLLPLIVTMTTSFTKFTIVLTLLRSALGVQQAPSNLVIAGIALAATLVVMGPTVAKIEAGLELRERLESNRMPNAVEIVDAVVPPLADFMLKHSRPEERAFLLAAAKRIDPERDASETDFTLLVPAFLISEISAGFEAGFLLYIAFLVIDLVVANVLTAMGMVMLSPTTVSVPLKLFVFVSVSGMSKLMHSLIVSYAP